MRGALRCPAELPSIKSALRISQNRAPSLISIKLGARQIGLKLCWAGVLGLSLYARSFVWLFF